jgi:hypothetical protein
MEQSITNKQIRVINKTLKRKSFRTLEREAKKGSPRIGGTSQRRSKKVQMKVQIREKPPEGGSQSIDSK